MKNLTIIMAAVIGIALVATVAPINVFAQGKTVQSLRGGDSIPDTPQANDIKRQSTAARFTKAYRQQPPMIPHRMEKYQINLKVNQCLGCHDWPYNVQEGAPKVSETHYTNRDGIALDKVTKSRWFCNQCHVPQVQARPLVNNSFKSSHEVDEK
jgi:nitrate reductase (cytochrome), electron transfer subunit